jgi:hypothetical protein
MPPPPRPPRPKAESEIAVLISRAISIILATNRNMDLSLRKIAMTG